MAKFVLRNCYVLVSVGTTPTQTDISSLVQSVGVDMTANPVEVTSMGAGAVQRIAGIRDDTFTLQAYSDFDSTTGLHSVLYPLFNTGATFGIRVLPSGSTASASNPWFGGTVSMTEYHPLSGAIGEAAMMPISLPLASGTITVGTS